MIKFDFHIILNDFKDNSLIKETGLWSNYEFFFDNKIDVGLHYEQGPYEYRIQGEIMNDNIPFGWYYEFKNLDPEKEIPIYAEKHKCSISEMCKCYTAIKSLEELGDLKELYQKAILWK